MLIKEELLLTPEDIRLLQRSMLPILIMALLMVGFFYLLGGFIFSQLDDSSMKLVVQGIFVFAGLLFAGISVYTIWSRMTDIRHGVKERLEGKVTDKRTVTKVNHTGGPGTSTERTRGRENYYIDIEGTEFKLAYKQFRQVKVGEHLIIERSPRSGFILSLKSA